jgi:hypothetical protein
MEVSCSEHPKEAFTTAKRLEALQLYPMQAMIS